MKHRENDLKQAIEILKLTPPFSLLDIKNAYKYYAKQLHPDKHPDPPGTLQEMERLNWAYHLLMTHFERLKVPWALLTASAQSEEERIQARFYYDWMPPHPKEKETA
jgi:curved DNA-binding protein CbpA